MNDIEMQRLILHEIGHSVDDFSRTLYTLSRIFGIEIGSYVPVASGDDPSDPHDPTIPFWRRVEDRADDFRDSCLYL
jgi:hypothetical protein